MIFFEYNSVETNIVKLSFNNFDKPINLLFIYRSSSSEVGKTLSKVIRENKKKYNFNVLIRNMNIIMIRDNESNNDYINLLMESGVCLSLTFNLYH